MKSNTFKPRANVAAMLALMLAVTTIVASVGTVYAATLTSASLALSDSRPDIASNYTVTASGFTTGVGNEIGCIEVDLGANANGSGAISGLDFTGITLGANTIPNGGSWSVNNDNAADAHKLRATAVSAVEANANGSITFNGVGNGDTNDTGYYAVVTTYATTGCATPVDTVTVQFIYTDGQEVTAEVSGSLSFTVAGVSSTAESVNGATINADTTGGGLPFGTIIANTNKIAAQDLTVGTNAGTGYTVYVRYTDTLKSGTNTINDLAGAPNSDPISFPGATEAFGYTTEDSTLGTGVADRFTNPTNQWAAFTTSNQELVYNSTPIINEETRVGFQAGITNTTAPGSYATTVVYTATPLY